jgi:sugar O-acyltransferase (sialic acid O-acetyltransferase NeuD family)
MAQDIVILGAGGHAREVLDIVEACIDNGSEYVVKGYIVESAHGTAGLMINDKSILGDFSWFDRHGENIAVVCGVGAPSLKFRLVQKTGAWNMPFISIIHPSAMLTKRVRIGQGVVVAAGCVLTNNIRLGDHVHINIACTVSHDVEINDFVTIAPGVHISGNVVIGTGAYIGTGATIVEKINIGEWSVVGAGSTVVDDVPPNSTIVGVPGKVIKTREAGWFKGKDSYRVV